MVHRRRNNSRFLRTMRYSWVTFASLHHKTEAR